MDSETGPQISLRWKSARTITFIQRTMLKLRLDRTPAAGLLLAGRSTVHLSGNEVDYLLSECVAYKQRRGTVSLCVYKLSADSSYSATRDG